MKARVTVNGGMTTVDQENGHAETCQYLHLLPAARILHLHFWQWRPFDKSMFLHLPFDTVHYPMKKQVKAQLLFQNIWFRCHSFDLHWHQLWLKCLLTETFTWMTSKHLLLALLSFENWWGYLRIECIILTLKEVWGSLNFMPGRWHWPGQCIDANFWSDMCLCW